MPATDTPRAIEAKAVLARLVRHTLEVMCFADAELLTCAPALDGAVTACAAFSGSQTGFLQLETEPATAYALAAACLGSDPSDAADTMRELAGIVCGRVVTALDPTGQFEMQPSHLIPQTIIQQVFGLGFGTLRVTLQLS